jgi:putative FmdB family regulatory protein
MPTYEYRCRDCGEALEVVQSFTDDPLAECPACEGSLKKVFAPPSISFKGDGFYKTDSRSGSSKKGGSTSSKDSDSSSDSSSKESSSDSSSSGDKTSSDKASSDKGSSDKGSSSDSKGSSKKKDAKTPSSSGS